MEAKQSEAGLNGFSAIDGPASSPERPYSDTSDVDNDARPLCHQHPRWGWSELIVLDVVCLKEQLFLPNVRRLKLRS
jgi:hypothetical protein